VDHRLGFRQNVGDIKLRQLLRGLVGGAALLELLLQAALEALSLKMDLGLDQVGRLFQQHGIDLGLGRRGRSRHGRGARSDWQGAEAGRLARCHGYLGSSFVCLASLGVVNYWATAVFYSAL
jgi:hypothetical protein